MSVILVIFALLLFFGVTSALVVGLCSRAPLIEEFSDRTGNDSEVVQARPQRSKSALDRTDAGQRRSVRLESRFAPRHRSKPRHGPVNLPR